MQRWNDCSGDRRSFIMLAVLVCMLSAIMVATSLLYISQTEAAGSAGSADAAQARSLLWSGAQALMSRLAEQRERILAGELPEIESQFTIYETDTRIGVVRLLPMNHGRVLSPEAARLDLNAVDAEALVRTGVIDRITADAVIAWRDGLGSPVQSITELLNAPRVTVESLYGSLEPLVAVNSDSMQEAHGGLHADADRPVRGLADVLTVFSAEPAVQSNGVRQINLNVPWSDELGKRIEERFGGEAAALLKQVFESGTKFDSDAALVKGMRAYNTPLDQWSAILDAFTTERGDMHFSRLDINTASRETLLALPGMTEELTDQIVSVRDDLTPEERGSAAWPVLRQILSPEAFEPLAGRISTRCWTYRVRIAAGEASADAVHGPLSNPLIQEMVIDLAGPKPRIAYLRDVTLLRDAALIASQSNAGREQSLLEVPETTATETPASQPIRRGREAIPSREDVAASQRAEPTADDEQPASEASDMPVRSRLGRWTGGG